MTVAQGTTVSQTVQGLDLDAQIIMYELDMTKIGGPLLRYHAGTNELKQSLIWQGNPYPFLPLFASGFEWSGKGPFPQPKLNVANIDGYFTTLTLATDDMIGTKVTRRRTLARFLDAANFSSGVNPTADPTQEFNKDVFYIERKAQDLGAVITFDLKTSFDMQGVMIPLRLILQNVCTWEYRSADCGWVPGPLYDINDTPTSDPTKDACGHRYHSCTQRFGVNAPRIPYGGAPAAGLVLT